MKNFLKTSTLCLVALAFVAASARAQTREEHFISAKAGGVNFVSGDVAARRAGAREWRGVSVKDDLRSGDAARTGSDGRVEVLLNPGSYLRAGGATEFELEDASLDSLRLRVSRGSVLVEATGYDSLGLNVRIATPRARVEIVRAGVYRVDVTEQGETIVEVQKGRALVGEGAAALLVKGGKEARAGAGGVEVSKLEKRQRDALDLWGRERGKELAKVNNTLANRQTNTLLASYNDVLDAFRADFPGSFGFWMWSAQRNCYTFLPFYTGWRSPYGFGYGSSFLYPDYYNCPGCPARPYRPVIVHNADPQFPPTPNTTYIRGVPAPSSPGTGGGGTLGGSSSGGMMTPSPSSVPRSERPARERTIEPGSPPLNR
jgi:FecR protein